MALNLIRAGHDLVVYNRSSGRDQAQLAAGAKAAATPKEAAAMAEVIVTCVSDTPDLKEVLLDPESGVINAAQKGALIIDCSTVSPDATREIAAQFERRGVAYVDAPISGGSEGAQQATLAIMCGGSAEAFERAKPILNLMGASINHVGASGAGQVAKAVNQVLIAGTYQALAEGLCLAAKSGVDADAVVAAISGGAAASWVLDNRSSNMIQNEYPLGFRLRLHRKDLGIALDTAGELGVNMPIAQACAHAEDQLISEGFGDEDMSALARLTRAQAKISPKDRL